MRLAQPPNPKIPIYLATLWPKALELTGELADGWLGTSFTPEHAEAHLRYTCGAAPSAPGAASPRSTLCVGCAPSASATTSSGWSPRASRSSRSRSARWDRAKTNFYNDAYRRGGFDDAAIEVQRLWLEGKRDEAAARVPDEMVLQSSLIGTEAMVRERVRKLPRRRHQHAAPRSAGRDPSERLDTLAPRARARAFFVGRENPALHEELDSNPVRCTAGVLLL